MKTKTGMALLLGTVIVVLSTVHAAEYFVTKQGNDANNGTSRETCRKDWKTAWGWDSSESPRMSLKEYEGIAGSTGSYVSDPNFAGTANMKPGGKLWTVHPSMMFDKLLDKPDIDFPDTFATDPKAVEKGVGPKPEAFEDFWFNKK